jgi:hypothetical protein
MAIAKLLRYVDLKEACVVSNRVDLGPCLCRSILGSPARLFHR